MYTSLVEEVCSLRLMLQSMPILFSSCHEVLCHQGSGDVDDERHDHENFRNAGS